tara:strand:- start:932 stop:1495 length:564 start_codon:yes stop_codon:yes gene_type:complete
MALTTVSNAGLAGSIDLTAKVTGALPVANGGTALTSGFINGVANAGKIGQVVSAVYSTESSTTSTSYVTTNLTASITPVATSSKVLIMAYLRATPYKASGTSSSLGLTLYKDASNILTATQTTTIQVSGNGANALGARVLQPLMYVDSPSTTSSTAYTVYIKAESGSTAYFHQSNCQGSIILQEILA